MKGANRFFIMGTILVLFVLVLSWASSSQAAATAVAQPAQVIEIVPNELESSTRVGNMYISDLTGAAVVLFGLNHPVTGSTPEAMARQYLRESTAVLKLQAADLSDLAYNFQHNGPAGPTVRFQQLVDDIPVYKAIVVVHINNHNQVTYVTNDYKSNINLSSLEATLTSNDARNAAMNYLDVQGALKVDTTNLVIYQIQDQSHLAYHVTLVTDAPAGDWEVMVDAHTGDLLKVVDTRISAGHQHEETASQTAVDSHQLPLNNSVPVTGTGTVFDPDPLSSAQATYGDPGYVDGSDANTPQLLAEIVTVDLPEIDLTGGIYTLKGSYAEITDFDPPFKGLFTQGSSTFNFTRFDDGFEAVNTYYHIDSSMRYIHEVLGLNIVPYQYVGGVRYDPHGFNGADNSFYSSALGAVSFGEGGVDDAEDSDVIHHELGHGLHDWVTNGGLSQVNGLSEGLGDYWAQSYNRSLGNWTPGDPQYNWVFNWDGHNPFWNGRVTNYGAIYPGGLTGQIHTDGQIWSTCNMRVYDAIGQVPMDTAMWEGLAMTGSSTNQEQAANAVYQAATDMGYSAAELQAFYDIYSTCVYVVPEPAADFTLTADPPSQQVCIPNEATYIVEIGAIAGYNDPVALNANGNPAGTTADFSVNNQPAPYTSTLTISNTTAAAPGDYTIQITGMGPTSTHSIDVELNLCAPEIAVDPTSVSSTQQSDTVVTHTLTISNTGTGTLDWTIDEYAPSTFMNNLTTVPYEEEVETAVNLTPRMQALLNDKQPPQNLQALGFTECIGGMAGPYPCQNVDLLSFLPLANIGGGSGNDSWGWTGCGGREFAIMGRSSGTSFVEITDPVNPIYLGNLPTHTSNSTWRDIKTYNDYAFIVSEASGHGMQVFDLSQLCNITNPPIPFFSSAHYNGFGNAHNLVINEDSGYAYGVGTGTCSGGLHMVNIQNPLSPTNAGCFSADGYTHDAQCAIYNGPDTQHQGKEICFNSNEDTLTVVDVTNKAAPAQLSRTGYAGSAYTHQGWLTEDQVHFLIDDELDESNFGHGTRTYIWNVSDLDNPVLIGNFTSTAAAIDHNQYVRGNYSFQANYRAGLRILDITDVANATLFEEAYFDIYPANNNANFNGAWSTYPYFDSGVVIISGIGEGLFMVRPTSLPEPEPVPCDTPADIPWLSVSPASGSTPEGGSTPVDVIFDSAGLTPGEYTASLCIGSNALTTPELFVPVSLTVADVPEIMITSPVSGSVLTAVNGTNISTTITVTTPNFTVPDDGHWHLWVDGVDTGPAYDYSQSVTLTLGTHVISAQLQYPDHTPVGPVDTIQVEVLAFGINILSPADGAVFTATNGVNISTTVTVTTPNFTIPDDGHWHLWLNGVDTGPVYGDSTTITLTVGTHVITAQLQAPDHTPLGPVDTITVTVVTEEGQTMFYIYMPVIRRDE